jgi:hypothetical protein
MRLPGESLKRNRTQYLFYFLQTAGEKLWPVGSRFVLVIAGVKVGK